MGSFTLPFKNYSIKRWPIRMD